MPRGLSQLPASNDGAAPCSAENNSGLRIIPGFELDVLKARGPQILFDSGFREEAHFERYSGSIVKRQIVKLFGGSVAASVDQAPDAVFF